MKSLFLTIFILSNGCFFTQDSSSVFRKFYIETYSSFSFRLANLPDQYKKMDIDYTKTNPLGIKAFYRFENKIIGKKKYNLALGLNLNYRQQHLYSNEVLTDTILVENWDDTYYQVYNLSEKEELNLRSVSLRFVLELNRIYSSKFESYTHFALGLNLNTKSRTVDGFKTDFPSVEIVQSDGNQYNNVVFPNPMFGIGLSFSKGFRYFYTENFGINLELSLGNYFFAAGFNYRF